MINVNSVGPYWLTFAFLPLLEKWKEHGYGSGARKFAPQIIMTSSMNGWTKDPATSGFSFPYLFSKAAIGQATSTLAHELLPLGIRVNGIAPGMSKWHSRERDTDTSHTGLFVTEMSKPGLMDEIGFSHSDKHSHNFVIPSQQLPPSLGGPTNVGGSHRDMGSLALFLVANFFVNGETVLIDGGVSPHLMFAQNCEIDQAYRPCSNTRRLTDCTLSLRRSKRPKESCHGCKGDSVLLVADVLDPT